MSDSYEFLERQMADLKAQQGYSLADLLTLHGCATVGELNAYIGNLERNDVRQRKEIERLEGVLTTIQTLALTENYVLRARPVEEPPTP